MCRSCPKRAPSPSQTKEDRQEKVREALVAIFGSPKEHKFKAFSELHLDKLKAIGVTVKDIRRFFPWISSDEGESN